MVFFWLELRKNVLAPGISRIKIIFRLQFNLCINVRGCHRAKTWPRLRFFFFLELSGGRGGDSQLPWELFFPPCQHCQSARWGSSASLSLCMFQWWSGRWQIHWMPPLHTHQDCKERKGKEKKEKGKLGQRIHNVHECDVRIKYNHVTSG